MLKSAARIRLILSALCAVFLSNCSSAAITSQTSLADAPPLPREEKPPLQYTPKIKEMEKIARELKAETEKVKAEQDREAEYY